MFGDAVWLMDLCVIVGFRLGLFGWLRLWNRGCLVLVGCCFGLVCGCFVCGFCVLCNLLFVMVGLCLCCGWLFVCVASGVGYVLLRLLIVLIMTFDFYLCLWFGLIV